MLYVLTAVLSALVTFLFFIFIVGKNLGKRLYGTIVIDEHNPEKDLFEFQFTNKAPGELVAGDFAIFKIYKAKESK